MLLTVTNISAKAGDSIYEQVNNNVCQSEIVEAYDATGPLTLPVSRDGLYDWYAHRDTLGPISMRLEVRPREAEASKLGVGHGHFTNDLKWNVSGSRLLGCEILPELHPRLRSPMCSVSIKWNLTGTPVGTTATWQMSLDDDPEEMKHEWSHGDDKPSNSVEVGGFTRTLLDATYECRVEDI